MKNFRFYANETAYNADKQIWNYVRPNISYIENYGNQGPKIMWNKNDGLYDILWVKNSDTSIKIITHNVLNVSEGYTPIALRVIGENFLGANEPSRWMSLKYMYFDNMNTTETGTRPFVTNAQNGSLTNVGMTWDETALYTPKTNVYTQEQLNTARFKSDWTNITYSWPDLGSSNSQITNGYTYNTNQLYDFSLNTYPDDKFINTTAVKKDYSYGYLPSDNFTTYMINTQTISEEIPASANTALFYEDILRGWHDNATSNNLCLPSLYTQNEKWVVSEYPTEYTSSYSLSRIHGKEATHAIVTAFKNNTNIISGNTTYVGKCDYQTRLEELKPFYCCSQYRTVGTSAGDWYLPACGELAFIIPDLKHIRARLTEISSLYPNDCMSTLAGTYYWSSSEIIWYYAWSVNTNNGYVSNTRKSYPFTVLAFLQYSA